MGRGLPDKGKAGKFLKCFPVSPAGDGGEFQARSPQKLTEGGCAEAPRDRPIEGTGPRDTGLEEGDNCKQPFCSLKVKHTHKKHPPTDTK